MKREKLLELLDKAGQMEEEVVAAISDDIRASFNWSFFSLEEKELVASSINKIKHDSERHKNLTEMMKKRVVEEKKNVY